MKIKIFAVLYTIILLSCAGHTPAFIPEPDFSVYATGKTIQTENITATKDGAAAHLMPEWLLAFIKGGNRAVEEQYNDKFIFVGVNEGENFIILNKWIENFSAEQDSAILIANRIEERMVLTSSLYPDDEYGLFFENFIKIACNAIYRDAVKEDIYWFKSGNLYSFFVLITINRNTMQLIIRNMMAQANAAANNAATPSSSQQTSVNRLRQTFFDGF